MGMFDASRRPCVAGSLLLIERLGGVRVLESALYRDHNIRPAFALHYDWTGWPTAGATLPPGCATIALETASLWEKDGLRLLESHATSEKIQILFSVTPRVSPTFFCMRAPGSYGSPFGSRS
jgi:hypothetical protein